MKQSSLLRSWQGIPFETSILKMLPDSFFKAYQLAIRNHGPNQFLKFYPAKGQPIVKTFVELDADVRRAASCLRANVKDVEILVTVAANSYFHVVFILAALLEGFPLCLINPDDDVALIENKCRLLNAKLAIWTENEIPRLASFGIPIHSIRSGWQSHSPITWAQEPSRHQRPFILVFTSGSTGYSKVVEQLEYNVLVNSEALIRHHRLTPEVILGTPLPIFHVNALEFSLLTGLIAGCRLVLFEKFQIHQILKAIETDQIQILNVIPQILRNFVQFQPRFRDYNLSSIHYLLSAAAPLSREMASAAVETLPFKVIQGYGLSEAVNFSATLPVDLSQDEHIKWMTAFKSPSIGTSLFGNEITVLNQNGETASAQEVGEICIRGHNVMKGYRGQDNSEIFRGHYLRTGDLGFYVPDASGGPYYFVCGRIKDVIKRQGLTVSLREVDDQIAKFPNSELAAIAVGFEHESSGEDLGLVVEDNGTVDFSSLKTFLDGIPENLRPKLVLFTADPVRTPSGKPSRWKFKNEFNKYRNQILPRGTVTLIHKTTKV